MLVAPPAARRCCWIHGRGPGRGRDPRAAGRRSSSTSRHRPGVPHRHVLMRGLRRCGGDRVRGRGFATVPLSRPGRAAVALAREEVKIDHAAGVILWDCSGRSRPRRGSWARYSSTGGCRARRGRTRPRASPRVPRLATTAPSRSTPATSAPRSSVLVIERAARDHVDLAATRRSARTRARPLPRPRGAHQTAGGRGRALMPGLALLERLPRSAQRGARSSDAMEAAQAERAPAFLEGLPSRTSLNVHRLAARRHHARQRARRRRLGLPATTNRGEGSGLVVPGTGVTSTT